MAAARMTVAPTGARRIELVLVLGALTAFAPLSIDMYLPAFPTITRAFHTDGGKVQLTLASFFLAFALGQALYGPVSDRFGRRKPLFTSLTIFIAASVGCAFSPDIGTLIGLRFVQGLGACAGAVIARAVVRDLFDREEAARIYSLLILVMGVAPMLAPTIGGKILMWGDWHTIFWVQVGAAVLCLLAVALRMPETHKAEHAASLYLPSILRTYWSIVRDRRFLGFCMVGAFALAGMFAYIAGAPFVFIEVFRLRPDEFGLLFGANATGFVVLAQVNGRLVPRFGARRLLTFGSTVQCLAAFVLVAVAASGGGLWAFIVPLWFTIACLGLMLPNATALAMQPFGRTAGSASALMGTIQFAMAACAASLMDALDAESTLPVAVVIATGAVLSAAVRIVGARE